MKIVKFPDPVLFKRCQEVTSFGPELKVILDGMWRIMKNANGLGLAANQIGLSLRMFVMEGPSEERLFIVNPRITKQAEILKANIKEGCLSAPGELLIIDRPAFTELEFQDETGALRKRVFKELWSVCVQHEIGHLNGESFLESKSIPKAKRKELAKKWKLK